MIPMPSSEEWICSTFSKAIITHEVLQVHITSYCHWPETLSLWQVSVRRVSMTITFVDYPWHYEVSMTGLVSFGKYHCKPSLTSRSQVYAKLVASRNKLTTEDDKYGSCGGRWFLWSLDVIKWSSWDPEISARILWAGISWGLSA